MAKGPVQRDMVNFTKFNNCRGRPGSLACTALSKVAGDVVSYYKALDVKPRGLQKFESPQGLALPRKNVEKLAAKSGVSANAVVTVQNSERRISKAISEAGSCVSSVALSTATGVNSVLSLRSGASGFSSRLMPAVDEEPQLDLTRLVPKFLQERRQTLAKEARALGYNSYKVETALSDGVAQHSLEALVENLVHARGNGSYKDAVAKVMPAKPRQVFSEPASRTSTKDIGEQSRRESRLSTMRDNISLTDFEDDDGIEDNAGTPSLSSRSPTSPTASYTQNFGLDRSQGGTKETTTSYAKSSSSFVRGVSRSVEGTKETVAGLRSSLKGSKESLRIAASSKESSFDRQRSPTFSLPGEVIDEGAQCTICLERPIDVQLLPCQHRVTCAQCMSQAGSLCPLCRTWVRDLKMF